MFKELFTDNIIIEGYKLQDFEDLMKKYKVPYDKVADYISVAGRYWREIEKAVKELKGKFKVIDARDKLNIKLMEAKDGKQDV